MSRRFFGGRPNKLPEVLSVEEANELLKQPNRNCPTGLRNYSMMLLMYRAGLRVSEIVNLREQDIDWQQGDIKVVDGKGGRDRIIPMELWVVDALKQWRGIKPKSMQFFCTLKGGKINDRYIREFVKRYGDKAGIKKSKGVHPHMLRHTFATELLGRGFNIREVQELLGHSDLSTTMIYTHVNPVEIRSKIRRRSNTRGNTIP